MIIKKMDSKEEEIMVPLQKVLMKNRVMVEANRHNNGRWPR